MIRRILFCFLAACLTASSYAQVQTPSEFLGYDLGSQFTPHYRVLEYFRYIASKNQNVRLAEYGKTNEGRTLLTAFISSTENIDRLEDIRKSNLALTGLHQAPSLADQPVIVWLSYNVHGNEAVSTEASMKTLYELVNPKNIINKEWLKNTVVIIDPCLNPDGHERYVNFYNPIRNLNADVNQYTREHVEPWPGGRANHYYFDLNRDWAWQTQVESQQRMALYNQWMPEVHVDFHEQGINDPYYFAPAAEPVHQDVTQWQKDFQEIIGKNNARYFDKNGWMYFTKERFDLLYPSYGDTYPTYNGSVGMTYEQGGGGRGGVAVVNLVGDTLSLGDRIEHHYTTGMSTIEASSDNAKKALSEFKAFFDKSKSNPPGEYKSYIIKGDNPEKLKKLAQLLDRNKISYGYGASKGGSGFNYATKKTESFSVAKNDMVITTYQPKAVLVKVLFEPQTFVADSNTYDITAWALPYAYGLTAYASHDVIKPLSAENSMDPGNALPAPNAVAYVADWNSVSDMKFLSELLKRNIKVRYSEIPFESGGRKFPAGSLIIARTSNESLGNNFSPTISNIAKSSGITLYSLSTGLAEKGADLGSSHFRYIAKPRVALIAGDQTSSLSVGEIWHFFEQQINYPLSLIRPQDVSRVNLGLYDVIIAPDGGFDGLSDDKMLAWIKAGGKLIAMEGSVSQLAGKKGFGLKEKEEEKKPGKEELKDPYEDVKVYADREKDYLKTSIPGAIYKLKLDNTHPLAFGMPDYYYTLKLDDRVYKFLADGWNVGILKKDNYITGFVGSNAKRTLVDGMIFGTEDIGNGSVVYLTDDVLFRSFWENGKMIFGNAVFMVGR